MRVLGFVVGCGLVPALSWADAAPDYLRDATWGSAGLCAPDAALTNETQIDAYSGPIPLIYLNEFGLSLVQEPVFCSFQTHFDGLLQADEVSSAILVCAGRDGFESITTIALAHTPETVGDSTPRLRLLDQQGTLTQDLYLCLEAESQTQ